MLPVAMCMFFAVGCGGGKGEESKALPEDFEQYDDTRKVETLMGMVTADSLARFIVDASLGRTKVCSIRDLPRASAYAYENYDDSCLVIFSREYDSYASSLPLADKMRVYYMAGEVDPMRMGYELGLEYVDHIRSERMSVPQIKEEISAFKDACGDDTLTYVRFVKGFRTVLKADHGKDLPEEVYEAFAE